MPAAKFGVLTAESSNLASTTLNSLANGSTSTTAMSYDNTPTGTGPYPTDKGDPYLFAHLVLGSLTPVANGSASLLMYLGIGSNIEDFGGTPHLILPKLLTTTTGAKRLIWALTPPQVALRFLIKNNAGVPFASSGNSFFVSTGPDAYS